MSYIFISNVYFQFQLTLCKENTTALIANTVSKSECEERGGSILRNQA